eukprot:g835.t1
MDHTNVTDYTNVKELDNVKVHVRLRPPDKNFGGAAAANDMYEASEKDGKKCIIALKSSGDGAKSRAQRHEFRFDNILTPETTQEEVFEKVGGPIVDHVLKGYNACCFAYGQTGSGKTYTMFGPEGGEIQQDMKGKRVRGLVPRTLEYLFAKLEELDHLDVNVTMTFMELYCDQLRDLGKSVFDKIKDSLGMQRKKDKIELAAMVGNKLLSKLKKKRKPTKNSLLESAKNFKSVSTSDWFEMKSRTGFGFSEFKIQEEDSGRITIKDSQQIPIHGAREVEVILNMGFKMRATHETKMNATSSRSHTICIFEISMKDPMTNEEKLSRLNMIDLAGSERVKKSEAAGQRLKEALFINSSLSALGKVVMMLDPTSGHNSKYVPFRDSKLTRLLQDSLGGNSYTAVLATVHPTASHYDESLGTMHFAAHCRNVKNQPRVNRGGDFTGGVERIKALMKEISLLKRKIGVVNSNCNMRIAALLSQLGVQGQMLSDGRVQLASGEIIGVQAEPGEGEEGGLTSDGASSAALGLGGAGSPIMIGAGGGRGGAGLESALKLRIKPLQDKIKNLNSKLQKARRQLTEAQEKHRSEQAALRDEINVEKDKANALQDQIDGLKSDKEEIIAEMDRKHEEQLNKLVENQSSVMKRHVEAAKVAKKNALEAVRRSQSRGKGGSEVTRKLTFGNKKTTVEEGNQKRNEEKMKRNERESQQIKNVRDQMKYFMDKKNEEVRQFVDKLNIFYAQKRNECKEYQKELTLLYEHCTNMASALRGKDTSETRTLSKSEVLKKPSIDVESFYQDAGRLQRLQKQLKVSRAAAQSSGVVESNGAIDTVSKTKKNIDFNYQKNVSPERSGLPPLGRESDESYRSGSFFNDDYEMTDKQIAERFGFEQLDVRTIGEMSIADLRESVSGLMSALTMAGRSEISLRREMTLDKRKLRALRVSYNSQKRTIEKMQNKSLIRKKATGSARAVGRREDDGEDYNYGPVKRKERRQRTRPASAARTRMMKPARPQSAAY